MLPNTDVIIKASSRLPISSLLPKNEKEADKITSFSTSPPTILLNRLVDFDEIRYGVDATEGDDDSVIFNVIA